MRLQCILAVWIMSSPAYAKADDSPPQSLVNMQRYRSNLRTARIEWSEWRFIGGQDIQNVKWNFTSKVAGSDLILQYRDRIVDGRRQSADEDPRQVLRQGGRDWENTSSADHGQEISVRSAEHSAAVPDLRSLGLSPVFSSGDVRRSVWEDAGAQPSPRRYSERVEGDLYVVTAKFEGGKKTWWIDPARDWSPVRVAFDGPGELALEGRISLRRFGETWFPETVQYFRPSYRDGNEPYDIVRVYAAQFNRPDQPKTLTPTDIGVKTGAMVEVAGAKPPIQYWNGKALVSHEEYLKSLKNKGLISDSEYDAYHVSQSRPASMRLSTSWKQDEFLIGWKQYVQGVIEHYGYDEAQTQQAWSVYDDARTRALAYLASRQPTCDAISGALEKMRKSGQPYRIDEFRKLERKLQKLTVPVEHIFEESLKPRVERLATRTQRGDTRPPATKP